LAEPLIDYIMDINYLLTLQFEEQVKRVLFLLAYYLFYED